MDGRDCNANEDRAMLERIVALLFALAGLADMAAGLPFLRRREVLGILGRGEAAARGYFACMASGALSRNDASPRDDASAGDASPVDPRESEDASCLAARFRALGFMLAALLTLTARSATPRAACPPPGGREPACPARCELAVPARRHDLPP